MSLTFKLNTYEEYHGGVEKVKNYIDNCSYCGKKLIMSHLPDYKNLIIQESSRCLDCGSVSSTVIYRLH